MQKKALITGVAGQDGTYLSEFLINKGYEVHGIISSYESSDFIRHRDLLKDVTLHPLDITIQEGIWNCIRKNQFDEIYNLASLSSPALSFQNPGKAFEVNSNSVLYMLEAIRRESPQTKFYQASSSELFGGIPNDVPQNEKTIFHPRSPYGVSKLSAHWLAVNYREAYGLKCCAGILFNHESHRRQGKFVTRKICDWINAYRKGDNTPLVLGNMNAKRDWGHADDFIRAMWMMMNPEDNWKGKSEPVFDEYVVGTGESISIKKFIEKGLNLIGKSVSWEKDSDILYHHDSIDEVIPVEKGVDESGNTIIKVSSEYWRPAEVVEVRANAEKIKKTLGWEPKLKIDDIIKEMIEN